mmetsp:Transcript_88332/g.175618  ORF Transcript_88332/g.175618 Transcript_88332/m.175618 type:complete len:257 (-) Transcript_88332:675-1445(-)
MLFTRRALCCQFQRVCVGVGGDGASSCPLPTAAVAVIGLPLGAACRLLRSAVALPPAADLGRGCACCGLDVDASVCCKYSLAAEPCISRCSAIARPIREAMHAKTSLRPARPARCRADCALRFSTLQSARRSSKSLHMSRSGAKNSGVCPCRSQTSISARTESNSCASSKLPVNTARCKAVTPLPSRSLTVALARSNNLARSTRPARTTACSGVPGPDHVSGGVVPRLSTIWTERNNRAVSGPSGQEPSSSGSIRR